MPREDPVKFMLKNMERRVGTNAMEQMGLVPSRSDATIMFSRYPDGTLRLYKPGSIIDDVPAGYSEENVTVKALVKRETEEFMVVIPITRTQLDTPSAEQFLHETAYSHKHRKAEDMRDNETDSPVETQEEDAHRYRRLVERKQSEDRNESSKPSDSGTRAPRNYLREGSASLPTSPSDSDARAGERSPDPLGTDERREDSTP